MRDFKYRELVTGRPEWEATLNGFSSIKSECLKPCAKAYQMNLVRMAYFAMFPAEFAYQIRRDTLFQTTATYRATGKFAATFDELKNAELTDKILKEFQILIDDHEALEPEQSERLRMDVGIGYVEAMTVNNRGMHIPMRYLNSVTVSRIPQGGLMHSSLKIWRDFRSLAR